MALIHAWTFTSDPGSTACSIHGGEQMIEQSFSVEYGGSPDRITAEALHGINWSKQTVYVGDDHVAGSDNGERADIYASGVTGAAQGNIRAYRLKALLRPTTPANEFNPTDGTNWNDCITNFHDSAGDWPGANIKLGVWVGNATDTQITDDPWVGVGGITSGDLLMHLWGGDAYGASARYNQQTFRFFPVGTWEQKVIDIALRVKWGQNTFDAGSQYWANWNGGAPTNLTQSGWIELQYRLGTPTNGSVTWGAWTWYAPTHWVNGPDPYRNYRPTLMWGMTAYWKLPNYRNGPGDGTSVARYADPKIGDTFTDVGAPEPTGPPPPPPPPGNATGRRYAVTFDALAVSGIQDLFEVAPVDDLPCRIVSCVLTPAVSTKTETALRFAIVRGHTTGGSGGSTVSPAPLDTTAELAEFTAKTGSTTIASAGVPVTLHAEAISSRSGWRYKPEPKCQPIVKQTDGTLVVRLLAAPSIPVTLSGTLIVEEN